MGELEGASARLEWNRMPRRPLWNKGSGAQRADFSSPYWLEK